ncbi:MAG: hypothetical protein ACE5D4_06195 [Thermodesulfobacteriota bacterium]
MTITSQIDSILKIYNRELASGKERSKHDKVTPGRVEQGGQEDSVTISEEGKRRIMERLKGEVLDYLLSGK